jgi:serine kinase of HPr protein (carbohydrate metabolism regulator)
MCDVNATIHASAALIGAKAALIRGPAGAGKSRLALALLQAAETGALPFARLVADDRVHVETHHGRVLVRPAAALAGLLEIRTVGIRRLPFEPIAAVGLVIDLGVEGAKRLPPPAERETTLAGIRVPRLAVAPGVEALPLVLALLRTGAAGN